MSLSLIDGLVAQHVSKYLLKILCHLGLLGDGAVVLYGENHWVPGVERQRGREREGEGVGGRMEGMREKRGRGGSQRGLRGKMKAVGRDGGVERTGRK